MEVDQEENLLSSPAFWRRSSSDHRRGGRMLSRTSSIALNSGALLVAVTVAVMAIVFVVVPSITSFASQVFRPQSVKKSWDSLNLVLVLFAVVCGFLSRSSGEGEGRETPKWSDSTPRLRWNGESSYRSSALGRMRSSSSYPDLRQESLWTATEDRWRFHDDTDVGDYHRTLDSDHQFWYRRRSWRESEEEKRGVEEVQEDRSPSVSLETKNIEVDTFEVRHKEEEEGEEEKEDRSSPALKPEEPSPPRRRYPSPPPPPPKEAAIARRKPRRSYRAIGGEKMEETENTVRSDISYSSSSSSQLPPPPSRPPPPPPPPPPPSEYYYQELEESVGAKSERKRGKEFLISLRKKKKKQRQKSVENFDAIFSAVDTPPSPPRPPPPPPPPMPPPPSVFQTLFSSKKAKTRKSQPPPPPPPPPPPSVRLSRNRTQSKPIPVTWRPAFLPESSVEVIGNESPLIPIPPPPPPPPFRVKEWRFTRRGDFVRVTSDISSRSASPEPFGGDESPMASSAAENSPAMSPARVFCPSPDVDTKADNFIARFRAGLMLEKENSFRERDGIGASGKSRLGLEAGLGREL